MHDYDTDDRVQIILGSPFLAMEEMLIDVREGTLAMRMTDEEVVFKVYKELNQPLPYKYLCIIIAMEVNKCRLEECKLLMTSLSYLIEWPKQKIKPYI